MPINLTALASKSATTTVDFMGQSAEIIYNPVLLTASGMSKAQDGGDAAFTEFFVSVVKDWDVKKGTKKVPLTQKGLESVPFLLLRHIFRAIVDESVSGEAERNSNDG